MKDWTELKYKQITLIMIVISFIVFIAYAGFYLPHMAKERFFSERISGIINEEKHFEGDRGYPWLKIDGQWKNLANFGVWAQRYSNVGDSIVKDSGTMTIIIYRKDEKNKWEAKVFE
jgi:hypothetical protein